VYRFWIFVKQVLSFILYVLCNVIVSNRRKVRCKWSHLIHIMCSCVQCAMQRKSVCWRAMACLAHLEQGPDPLHPGQPPSPPPVPVPDWPDAVQSGIPTFLYTCQWTLTLTWSIDMECSIDMNMQHGHGHAVWIWLGSMDLDSAHAWMHRCRNADEKLSPALLVFR
jgi:hypothetical protein